MTTTSDVRRAPRHEGLLSHPDGRHRRSLDAWVRSVVEQTAKIVALAPPDSPNLLPDAARATALTPDVRDPAAQLHEQLHHAVDEGFGGLGIVVWADNVIAATSVGFHTIVEATLDDLCRDDGVSVLCVYNRTRTDLLGMAVEQHPDGLDDVTLTVRRRERTLLLAGEIDMDNLAVLDAVLNTAGPNHHLDLTDVGFLSAAAAHRIGRYLTDFRAVEGGALIRGARPPVQRVLRLGDVPGDRGSG